MRGVLVIFLALFLYGPIAIAEEIWKGSFHSQQWPTEWQVRPSRHFGLKETRIIRSESEPSLLRVFFPKGSATRSLSRKHDLPYGGAQFLTSVPSFPKSGVEEAVLTYQVRFAKGFDFVKGGKLPGLFGGDHISGKEYPSGANGLSTRLHWREDGYGEIKAYLPVDGGSAPEFGKKSIRFQPGKWHLVRQQVVLNDPKKENGRLLLWFDGKLVINEQKVFYRTSSKLKIEGLFFSTFFGGGTKEWASRKDTHADFRGFSVIWP